MSFAKRSFRWGAARRLALPALLLAAGCGDPAPDPAPEAPAAETARSELPEVRYYVIAEG